MASTSQLDRSARLSLAHRITRRSARRPGSLTVAARNRHPAHPGNPCFPTPEIADRHHASQLIAIPYESFRQAGLFLLIRRLPRARAKRPSPGLHSIAPRFGALCRKGSIPTFAKLQGLPLLRWRPICRLRQRFSTRKLVPGTETSRRRFRTSGRSCHRGHSRAGNGRPAESWGRPARGAPPSGGRGAPARRPCPPAIFPRSLAE